MVSVKVKVTALVIVGLLLSGLISVLVYSSFFAAQPGDAAPAARKVLYWYDPMKPDTRFDKPGRSPFMAMDLVPKYADEANDENRPGMRIDPTQVQNLGVKTEKVRRGSLSWAQTLPATVSFNDYQFVIVQARTAGFVEKVFPLTVGDNVRKGTPLAEVTLPDWVAAQSEYLLLSTTGGSSIALKGVLERLRLGGMPEADIQRLRQTRQIQTRFTITAPIDGVITAFDLRSGMNITKESVVARIQGMDPVWISAALPASMSWLLQENTRFTLALPAYPDTPFTIEKWNVLPSVDPATRTLDVRLQVGNKAALLKPGMNAYLTFSTRSQPMLLIPSQALIDSGSEQRVITVDDDGRFVPKTVSVLHESQQQTGISAGLVEGESVVVNGLFLIDSEANISGALARMRQAEKPAMVMPDMPATHDMSAMPDMPDMPDMPEMTDPSAPMHSGH